MKKIQKYIKKGSLSMVLASFVLVGAVGFVSQPAFAQCGGTDTAIIKCDQNNGGGVEDNGVWGILLLVLRIMTAGVGIVAVGGIAYGALLYASAGDKSEQVKKGVGVIQNVVVGLVLYAGMYAILEFIIPGGIIG